MRCHRHWTALRVLLAAATALSPASAQIQQGRTYAGGDTLVDPESGLRLTMPDGWTGRLSASGEAFEMRSTQGGGIMVVIAEPLTAEDARRRMAQRIELGDGLVLVPADSVREIATGHLSGSYTVTGAASTLVGRVDVRLARSGLGVAFVLLSPPAEVEIHESTLRAFAFSLGVRDPGRQASASSLVGAESDDAWAPYLKGKYLARYFTRTGYTESTELWLCSDGTFRYTSQGGGFGGGASGASLGRGNGRWSASGAGETGSLVLHWSGGGQTTLALRYDYANNRLFVDGERFLRGRNEVCQ